MIRVVEFQIAFIEFMEEKMLPGGEEQRTILSEE